MNDEINFQSSVYGGRKKSVCLCGTYRRRCPYVQPFRLTYSLICVVFLVVCDVGQRRLAIETDFDLLES